MTRAEDVALSVVTWFVATVAGIGLSLALAAWVASW